MDEWEDFGWISLHSKTKYTAKSKYSTSPKSVPNFYASKRDKNFEV